MLRPMDVRPGQSLLGALLVVAMAGCSGASRDVARAQDGGAAVRVTSEPAQPPVSTPSPTELETAAAVVPSKDAAVAPAREPSPAPPTKPRTQPRTATATSRTPQPTASKTADAGPGARPARWGDVPVTAPPPDVLVTMNARERESEQGRAFTGSFRIENRSAERFLITDCGPSGGLWRDGRYVGGHEPRACPAIAQYLEPGQVIDGDYQVLPYSYEDQERRTALPSGYYWLTFGLAVSRGPDQQVYWAAEAVTVRIG